WGDGIWLTWMIPATGEAGGVAGSQQGVEQIPQQSNTLSDFTASLMTSALIPQAIIGNAQIPPDAQTSGMKLPLDDDTARTLVYTLGVPRANVEHLLDQVNQQIKLDSAATAKMSGTTAL